MELLEDGVLAALAAVGLVTLFLLLSALLRPLGHSAALAATAVIPCRGGEGEQLECTVRALERLCRENGCIRRVVILDLGMDEDEKKLAYLLCRDGAVRLVDKNCTWEEIV